MRSIARRRAWMVPAVWRLPGLTPGTCRSNRPRVSHAFPGRRQRLAGDRRHSCRLARDQISLPFELPLASERGRDQVVPRETNRPEPARLGRSSARPFSVL